MARRRLVNGQLTECWGGGLDNKVGQKLFVYQGSSVELQGCGI